MAAHTHPRVYPDRLARPLLLRRVCSMPTPTGAHVRVPPQPNLKHHLIAHTCHSPPRPRPPIHPIANRDRTSLGRTAHLIDCADTSPSPTHLLCIPSPGPSSDVFIVRFVGLGSSAPIAI